MEPETGSCFWSSSFLPSWSRAPCPGCSRPHIRRRIPASRPAGPPGEVEREPPTGPGIGHSSKPWLVLKEKAVWRGTSVWVRRAATRGSGSFLTTASWSWGVHLANWKSGYESPETTRHFPSIRKSSLGLGSKWCSNIAISSLPSSVLRSHKNISATKMLPPVFFPYVWYSIQNTL